LSREDKDRLMADLIGLCDDEWERKAGS